MSIYKIKYTDPRNITTENIYIGNIFDEYHKKLMKMNIDRGFKIISVKQHKETIKNPLNMVKRWALRIDNTYNFMGRPVKVINTRYLESWKQEGKPYLVFEKQKELDKYKEDLEQVKLGNDGPKLDDKIIKEIKERLVCVNMANKNFVLLRPEVWKV